MVIDQTSDAHNERHSDALPPSTNRGVTITTHWLSLTFFTHAAKATSNLLTQFMDYTVDDELEWSSYFHCLNHGARGYSAMYIGPSGVRLYAYPHTGTHCHIEIPGGGSRKSQEWIKPYLICPP